MASVWIANPFDNLPEEGAKPQRYALLAGELASRGHEVVWWTSSFSHSRKDARKSPAGAPLPAAWKSECGYSVRLVPTPPYRSNIGLSRVINHRAYAENLVRDAVAVVEEGSLARPDVIVASTPPLSTGAALSLFKERFGCRIVIDVMDAWPDAFCTLLPGPTTLRHFAMATAFAPMVSMSRKAFAVADAVSATSRRNLAFAAERGAKCPAMLFPHACSTRRSMPLQPFRAGEPLRIAYAGNMGRFYDMLTLVEAVRRAGASGLRVTLDVAGSGPQEQSLRRQAGGCSVIRFHGFLGAGDLQTMLESCHVGAIPLKPESQVAMPYKLPDYAGAGLAIVECLGGECGETVSRAGAGLHYEAGDAAALEGVLRKLASAPEALDAMRAAALVLADEQLIAERIYPAFADFVLSNSRKFS